MFRLQILGHVLLCSEAQSNLAVVHYRVGLKIYIREFDLRHVDLEYF
jgi:hypothetical protein